jgi:LPXTG-motif cell wall-anchored protein
MPPMSSSLSPHRRVAVALGVLSVLLVAAPARAHSYADPALRTVFDGLQPASLPPGVAVAVQPSVVDELVLSNSTATPLDVLAIGGEPFLRVSSAGVLANLASPDWYATGTPEGGPPLPADVVRDRGRGTPRWARVSTGDTWSEFDPRLHPAAAASPSVRVAGRDRVLRTWSIPLRYGGRPLQATGHVLFSPVRGGLLVALGHAPQGLTAGALQGELPGVFLRVPAELRVEVQGRDGRPFLRFGAGVVQANTASASWADDQRARGRTAPPSGDVPHWTVVARSQSLSWLDPRLRYPADEPGQDVLARSSPTVLAHWTVPLLVDGASAALEGTVSWVPRRTALAQIGVRSSSRGSGTPWLGLAGAVLVVVAGALVVRRRRTEVRGLPKEN